MEEKELHGMYLGQNFTLCVRTYNPSSLQSWKNLWQLPCYPAALMALLGTLIFTSKNNN